MLSVTENDQATEPGPGAIVVCRFPKDTAALSLALCLYIRRDGDKVLVRKAAGVPYGYRHSRWRWATIRAIPVGDVMRLSTERERSVRHVIGGGAGEKLTGAGAGGVRR